MELSDGGYGAWGWNCVRWTNELVARVGENGVCMDEVVKKIDGWVE